MTYVRGALVAVVFLAALPLAAEQLPIRTLTTTEGLPRNVVNRIVQDPRGFLWFATSEGLALFDGDRVTTFGAREGLPDPEIYDLVVTRHGEYWVATRKGLARFRPDAAKDRQPRFVTFVPAGMRADQRILRVQESEDGTLWCSTLEAVYRIRRAGPDVVFDPVALPPTTPPAVVVTFLVDRAGVLWVATTRGVYRATDAVAALHWSAADLPDANVTALLQDRRGRMWVGTSKGVAVFAADGHRLPHIAVDGRDSRGGVQINALLESSDGVTWAATSDGLREYQPVASTSFERHTYQRRHGLPFPGVSTLTEDRDGNIWMGTEGGGAAQILRRGLVSFDAADGLRDLHITSIFETPAREVCVTTAPYDGWIYCYDGSRFLPFRPAYPRGTRFNWGWNRIIARAGVGEWWFATADGAWQFPAARDGAALAGATPIGRLDLATGLPSNDVFRVFDDRRGDLWISTLGLSARGTPVQLSKWERATHRISTYALERGPATAFATDAASNVWMGFYTGGLSRVRARDRFEHFGAAEGMPEGMVLDLHRDTAGRLWAATSRGGLARIDAPTAEHPRIRVVTTADGLSSNSVRCITADRWGRLYAGTGRGVDRITVQTDDIGIGVHTLTTADGLAPGEPTVAFADSDGRLWFGTARGLSRLVPALDPGPPAPRVFITDVLVAGQRRPLADVGETTVTLRDLGAGERGLQVGFAAPGVTPGASLRYQYRLGDADAAWSAPSAERSVVLAGLNPGEYTFEVRAVTRDGAMSDMPAAVTFTVAAPVWQRWWFRAIVVALVALVAYLGHRARMAKVIALARVRTEIATDLHDDIGSGLTRVAILSELVLREARDEAVRGPVERIAALSRQLGESMGDIVWSVNPGKDSLLELAHRMRRFASEVLGARDVRLSFTGPGQEDDRRLEPEVRREALLVLKESVNNVVRHSGCTEVRIALNVADRSLHLEVVDNGTGFDATRASAGNGLRNMERRAARLGGRLAVRSRNGGGTTVTLVVPLTRGGYTWRRSLPILGGSRTRDDG